MPYPQMRVNWTVVVNQPDPDILAVLLPKSQNVQKEVLSTKKSRKYSKEVREDNRKINEVYRKEITSGFNLLKKCVPGIEKSTRPEILMSTVNYIRELEKCIEKKINYTRLFSTPTDCDPVPSTSMKRGSGPTTLHYYPVPSTDMEQESDSTLDCYIVDY
jgi:hypothetical protein